ncbi:MAG: ABC transporter substrate-binding protein [Planctomycetota bacterium]|jgi:ABC-type transport system substrate-binding protein
MLGTTLQDRYVLNGELGRGGMGVVYRAHDPVLNRDVAVKVIPPTHVSEESEERFHREAQMVAQMDHPGIVPVHDFGRHEDSMYLVMPVVPGKSLRPFLDDRSLTLGDVLDIGIAVAEALDYSHSRGIVHRDIKPENIMLEREGSGRLRVRVMDFGLARVNTKTRITQTGMLVGTMGYLSPEQITSNEADHRCDIYSLGTVLYECIAGRIPFAGEMQSILYRIVHEVPPTLAESGVDVPPDLEQAVMQCLAKEPDERPSRAGVVAEALHRARSNLRESERRKSMVAAGTGAMPRPALSPFVGRKNELATLQKRLQAAVAGECQLVVIGGEPGCGKTRLVDELESLARARNLRVLHGRFVEQQSFPYQGFCEAIQEYFRQQATDTNQDPIDFSDIAPELLALFPMLGEIDEIRSISSGHQHPSDTSMVHQPEHKTQVFELLARALTRIAAGKPLVLLLEELHGADVSIEALQYIIPRLGPTSTLVVGTYRTTEVDRHHLVSKLLDAYRGDRRFESMTIGSLSKSEHRHFLETLVGGSELADDLIDRVYERTEGNPFFTKELMRSLMDSQSIDRDDTGRWNLTGQARIRSETLPETIQQAVEKRVQRLPSEHRDILSIAAVLGKTFDFRDVEDLATSVDDIDDAVEQLVNEGLLEEVPGARSDLLTFSSGLVRDVLYGELSRRKRRSLHRKCAKQIEKRQQGRLERAYPELLFHYSEGDVPEKTVEYGIALAERSLKAFSPEEAMRAARLALEFLDDEWEGDPAREGDARLLLASGQRMTGDIDSALMQAGKAAEVFQREEQASRAAEALLFSAETAWQARRPDETAVLVERGMMAARAADHSDVLRELISLGATLANLRGEYQRANELLREAEELGATVNSREAEESQRRGGRLVVPLSTPVRATVPAESELASEAEVFTNVYETLLSMDDDGTVVPGLCDRWEAVEEGRAFRLFLRPDIVFHDGHALAAADAKASMELGVRQGGEIVPNAYREIEGFEEFQAGRIDELPGIVVRSDRELEIRTKERLPIYPAMLTDFRTGIGRAAHDGRLLGTGPFRITRQDTEHINLERNDDYWGGTTTFLDSIEFRPYMTPTAIADGARTGELDCARDLLPEDLESMLRDPRFRGALIETPKQNTNFVLFNSGSGLLADQPELRRALASTVRPTDLVWKTIGRFGQPATCLLPPGILGHDPGGKRAPIDPERARQAIAELGMTTPIRLRVALHPSIQEQCAALVQSLFDVWAEIGVEAEIVTESLGAFLEASATGRGAEVLITRWYPDYGDPDSFANTLFHSETGQLCNWFSSDQSDQLLDAARADSNPVAREATYREWERLLHDEALLVPLFHEIDYRVLGQRVRDARLGASGPFLNYSQISKTEATDARSLLAAAPVGTIEVPMAGTVETMDRIGSTSVEEAEVLGAVFETLTRHVHHVRITPALASSFRVEDGGKRYRFLLRRDVRFHDGRRLSARDVRFSFERLLQKGFGTLLSPVRGATAFANGEISYLPGFKIHSAHEFTIELEKPVAFFPVLLSHPVAGILPEGTKRLGESWQDGCVGTGPFRVVRFKPGARLELERNPHYWRQGSPKSERVVFTFRVDPTEILREFKSGRYSICSDLYPEDVERLYRDPDFGSGYRESPHLSTYFVAVNRHRDHLADVSVRRRMLRSVDVDALVRRSLGRLAIPASGLIPPGLLGHDPTARASAARVESDGDPIEVTAAVHPLFLGKFASLWEAVKRAFSEVGVTVRQANQDVPGYIQAIEGSEVDLIVGRWVGDYPDADSFMHGLLHTTEGFLGSLCGSAEIDARIAAGRPESDPAARHAIYRGIEEVISREGLLLPLFHEQIYRFARPEVRGLNVSYWVPAVRYEDLRVQT